MSAPGRGAIVADLPHRSAYDLLGHRVAVVSNSAAFIDALDRLNARFLAAWTEAPDARYEAVDLHAGRIWELTYQDEELGWRDSLMEAVGRVEWHMVEGAVQRRSDLLHVHGAALAGPRATLLLTGGSGIGKTTLALALKLAGLRLFADDVAFFETERWRPLPFPRSPHVHDDALRRLAPLGLRYAADDHLGRYLCAAALDPWPRRPGPPLRYLLFPEREPEGESALEPLTHAEAAVRLMRYSENLRRFPRFGLDLLPRLLRHAECFVLRRDDDLAAAAAAVAALVQRRA